MINCDKSYTNYIIFGIYKTINENMICLNTRLFMIKIVIGFCFKVVKIDENNIYRDITLREWNTTVLI